MKKLTVLLAVIVLLVFQTSAMAASKKQSEVFCYDFDLRFHLSAEEYPLRERSRIQGYADLLEMLEFRGNVAWCPDTQSIDLNAELIPVTNPASSISFRLYGIPDYMCLTSPLLESETIFLHNYALMEFAGKTWMTFHIPLPYVVLLDPYVTIGAFDCLVKDWTEQFPKLSKSQSLAQAKLAKVAENWKKHLESDYRLTSWMTAATSPLEEGAIVHRELLSLPDMLMYVSNQRDLKVSVKNRTLRVSNNQKKVLFEQTVSDTSYTCSLTLPDTGTRYIPSFIYQAEEKEGIRSLSLHADWIRSEMVDLDLEDLPESLLQLSLDLSGVPQVFPADTSIRAALKIDGYALPSCDITLQLDTSEEGNVLLSLSRPMEDRPSVTVFRCSGKVAPSSYDGTLKFKASKLKKNFNIFSVNDQTLYEFVHRTARPLFNGLLNFLYEIPASSCQSIMDELEDHGILELILK